MNFWRFLSCRQTIIRQTLYAIEIKKQNIVLPFGECPMEQIHKARKTRTRNMFPTQKKNCFSADLVIALVFMSPLYVTFIRYL